MVMHRGEQRYKFDLSWDRAEVCSKAAIGEPQCKNGKKITVPKSFQIR